jgi:hypothetical protein
MSVPTKITLGEEKRGIELTSVKRRPKLQEGNGGTKRRSKMLKGGGEAKKGIKETIKGGLSIFTCNSM